MKMEKKSRTIPVIAAIAFCIVACCFQIPVFAKPAKATVTEGKEYYREFLMDNVLHSPENGDIHYHVYFPDSYDGKKKMALYVTLPGYQGLYFQGVAENLKTEDFAFEAQKYNKDMVILAPQLDDWGETSAEQTIALVEYFLDHYPIDPAKVFINGYSGGGETLSLVLEKRPELFARALMCSSQWDGEYGPVVKARTPVYFVIGESDEYYSSKPFRDAYKKLHGLYQKEGLSEKEIKKLLVLDVKGSSYFKRTGITYQHGGGWLFCRDKEIMNWLFASAQERAKATAKKPKLSITLNKSVYTLKKGKTVKLKAALNKAAKKKGVEWKSSKPKVASVSKNGKVTAKKNGKATITARIKGTKVKASSRITVGTPVSKIKLNRKSVSLKTGQKFTLKTTVSPKKAAVKKVSYKSSSKKTATVSKKGVIRAVSAGTAKITVTAADGSGKKASCTVKVKENTVPVTSIALNKSQLNLKQGEEEKLVATVKPSNATDKTVRWKSSSQSVVQVSGNGTVKAVAEGTAMVTASAHNNVQAVCSVTVKSVSEEPTEPEKPTEPEEPSVPGKVTKDTTVSEIKNDPAFGDFGRLLFPVDRTVSDGMTLEEISSSNVYTWYSNIKADKTVEIVNDLKLRSENGEQIFYPIYLEKEMKENPEKRDTGLFYFKGKPGAKYAIFNAGGGFAYVGAMHDSFPHALEVSKKGYHAFALIYRPDSAYEDLAKAIMYVHDHAKELGVDTEGYSLWGGSAGARMAATLGNKEHGPANYGRPDIPQAAAVIMQYTGYADASKSDAPTYACVGMSDGIADYRTMESRLSQLQAFGIPTEFHVYEGLGHGFGLRTGTVAEGWIEDAIAFWEAQGVENPVEPGNPEDSKSLSGIVPDELEYIPSEYRQPSEHPGTLEKLTYQTWESFSYEEHTQALSKEAWVYLPYGYSVEQKYPVFYLSHGGWSNETTIMGTDRSPRSFNNVVDNAIEDGKIQPMIIVLPTYNNTSGSDSGNYSLALQLTDQFHNELLNDLIPAVESRYSTYATDTTSEGLAASRDYRGFGGFSMGSVNTWCTFRYALDYFRYFMPMSGSYRDGETMAQFVKESGHTWNDFFIFSASGTNDFAYSAFKSQIMSMGNGTDGVFRFANNETDGNLSFLERDGYSHDVTAMDEYTYNGLRFFWNKENLNEALK